MRRGSPFRGRALALVVALGGCKSPTKEAPAPPPPKAADAAIVDAADWTAACAAALTAKATPVRKLRAIIDGCRPCGDWQPVLDWATPASAGGPPGQAIVDALAACDAFCTNDARTQFAAALDDARDSGSNKPWRVLGDQCKEAVSAVPDARFMSAPYFALDRIARAAAADARLAPLLAAIEVPLPAVSLTGGGFELPVSPVMKPEPGRFHVTVTQAELRVGAMPTAKLTADGVRVELGATPYPGERVAPGELAAKLDALTGSPTARVLVIAPPALPASRVVDVVAAAGAHELVLAVGAAGGPPGWTLPGIVPVVLDAKRVPARTEWQLDASELDTAALKARPAAAFDHPRISITKTATVAHLAKLLGALAFRDARSASLAKK